MIKFAIDKRTQKLVPISKATKDESHECEYCGVDLYPVDGSVNDFFRCFEGKPHKRPICAQMAQRSSSNRNIYNAEEINPTDFFQGLFTPAQGENGGNSGTGVTAGGHPTVPPMGGETPEEFVIVPCRTLGQLWRAKVAEMPHCMWIGDGCILSDIYLKQKVYWIYLEKGTVLNNRILELRPLFPDRYGKRFISFGASWEVKSECGFFRHNELFILRFADANLFDNMYQKLFALEVKENGTSERVRLYDGVLVAGCWHKCEPEDYNAYGLKLDTNCIGVQIADCISKQQIFGIPETRRKRK